MRVIKTHDETTDLDHRQAAKNIKKEAECLESKYQNL